MNQPRTAAEENTFLKKQLRLRVDLGGNGEVTLISPYKDIPEQDTADIQMLTKQPQWVAFRKWYLLNAKMLYEQSALYGKDEAYILSRLAKCLIDMFEAAERIEPEKPQKSQGDAYDLGQNINLPDTPGDSLPLGDV